jgi:hypothetical protein
MMLWRAFPAARAVIVQALTRQTPIDELKYSQ